MRFLLSATLAAVFMFQPSICEAQLDVATTARKEAERFAGLAKTAKMKAESARDAAKKHSDAAADARPDDVDHAQAKQAATDASSEAKSARANADLAAAELAKANAAAANEVNKVAATAQVVAAQSAVKEAEAAAKAAEAAVQIAQQSESSVEPLKDFSELGLGDSTTAQELAANVQTILDVRIGTQRGAMQVLSRVGARLDALSSKFDSSFTFTEYEEFVKTETDNVLQELVSKPQLSFWMQASKEIVELVKQSPLHTDKLGSMQFRALLKAAFADGSALEQAHRNAVASLTTEEQKVLRGTTTLLKAEEVETAPGTTVFYPGVDPAPITTIDKILALFEESGKKFTENDDPDLYIKLVKGKTDAIFKDLPNDDTKQGWTNGRDTLLSILAEKAKSPGGEIDMRKLLGFVRRPVRMALQFEKQRITGILRIASPSGSSGGSRSGAGRGRGRRRGPCCLGILFPQLDRK